MVLVMALIGTVNACEQYQCCAPTVNNNVTTLVTQVQWMTQQQEQMQSQAQQQEQHQEVNVAGGTTNSWISSGSSTLPSTVGGIEQTSQTYSRLVYPGEVLTFPVGPERRCTLLAGLPVGFYTIGSMYGESDYKVQSLEAKPTYNEFFHHMEFGMVPPVDKIDYWTMRAILKVSDEAAYCVVDNRAPMNGYTTIEVVVA
jgi:hypothetical protein